VLHVHRLRLQGALDQLTACWQHQPLEVSHSGLRGGQFLEPQPPASENSAGRMWLGRLVPSRPARPLPSGRR
jgi:hypothetical protein